ncbi:MAG: hypothetical protein V4812_02840 [Pseudomonadota bacterium]
MKISTDIRVYGAPDGTLLPSGIRRRGHIQLIPGPELLGGLNQVWREGGWKVGAVAIVTEATPETIASVLRYCSGPSIWSSRHQMKKGGPNSALTFCERSAAEGKACFLTSSSNGVQLLDIFVPAERYAETFELAVRECREFKPFIEHNPENTSELVIDRPPYSDAYAGT